MRRQNKLYLMFLTLPVFLVQAGPNLLGPHMATFAALFPQIPLDTIMLLQNIPTAMGVIAGALAGPIQKRLGLRGCLILGCALFVGGGLLPLLAVDRFSLILLSRVIYGFGFGFLYAFAPNLVIGLFTEAERPRMLGLGTTFQTLGVIVFSLGGTLLASKHFHNIWLAHLLLLLPLVLGLFLREPERQPGRSTVPKASGGRERLTRDSWFLILALGLCGLFFMPMFTLLSNVVVDNGFGTTTQASFVLTVLGASGIVGSLLYSALANRLSARISLPVGAALFAVGNVLIGISRSMTYLYVGAVLIEIGFTWIFPTIFNLLAIVTPPSRIPAANGIQTAIFNGFSAVSSYVMLPLLRLIGKGQDLRFAFLISAGYFVIFAVVFLFYRPKCYAPPQTQSA